MISAQWALWGKEPRDTKYRLLTCSDGHISADTFVEQITSFSPGSAPSWPQFTVSAFGPVYGVHYIALAVHGTAEGQYDAGGREIVFTRYFCVPYQELAEDQLGYRAMHAAFGRFWPTAHSRSVLSRDSAPPDSMGIPPVQEHLARRTAALLLTSRPVCILDADGVGAAERLAFIDAVMWLLPYGMRSGFAGGTWASSTAHELSLRLFFADARPRGTSHVVRWGQPGQDPVGHEYADQYLRWLTMSPPDLTRRLAAARDTAGFDPADVARMMKLLDVSYADPPPAQASYRGAAVAPAAGRAPAPAVTAKHVADVLHECGRRLRGGSPDLLVLELNKLQACLGYHPSPEDRGKLAQVVSNERLLRTQKLSKELRTRLYQLVLRMVFGSPLGYDGWCLMEACLGAEPHKQLAEVVEPADVRVGLLAARVIGAGFLKRTLQDLRLQPAALAAAIADASVRADHAEILCELAIPVLRECQDPFALRQALAQNAYLVPAFQRLFPAQSQRQYELLAALLRASHGDHLVRGDIPPILGEGAPNVALFLAVLELTGPADRPEAVAQFMRATMASARFDPQTKGRALDLLPRPPGGEIQLPATPPPGQGKSWRGRIGLAPTWRDNKQS